MTDSTKPLTSFWGSLCRTNGFPSSSKFLAVLGGMTAAFVLVWTTIKGSVPERLPELVGVVIFALVLGRGVSKATNAWEQVRKNDGPNQGT